MEEGLSVDDFKRWKVPQLREFLRERGLSHSSKRKDELVALVFAAYKEKRPKTVSGSEARGVKAADYQNLLLCRNGKRFTDPCDMVDGWKPEKTGMELWPPTMHVDIAEYLLTHVQDRNLGKRLLGDYKEGKAYSYFDAKWLKEVFYHDGSGTDSRLCFLKSQSTPSERLNDIPHNIWVAIDKKTGSVESAYCTCFAGLGSTCNHIAAILFKIEYAWQQGWTNKACTSRPCEWNLYGAGRRVVEPKRIGDMEWRKPHHKKKGKKIGINPPTRQLFAPRKKKSSHPEPSLEGIISSMYTSCPHACGFQYAPFTSEVVYPPEEDFNVCQTVEVQTSAEIPPNLPALVKGSTDSSDFITNLPTLTVGECEALEEATRLQGNSTEWKEQRVGRIPGSVAHRVMTRVRTIKSAPEIPHNVNSLVSQIMGYTSVPEHIPALKYGRSMEAEARMRYKDSLSSAGHSRVIVNECGLCIHPKNIYIGASPDGYVHCDCCGDGLLEIKCPYSIAHENPEHAALSYLRFDGKVHSLEKNHPYYSQVQHQLGVTGKQWCDFFVYTRHGSVTERIYPDCERWNELLLNAMFFFRYYVAPELVSRALESDIRQSEESMPITVIQESGIASNSKIEMQSTGDRFEPLPTASSCSPDTLSAVTLIDKQSTSTRKKKGKRSKHAFSPLYTCNICNNLCKESTDVTRESDNSVQCDNEHCGLWYHWLCVDFDGAEGMWLCSKCSGSI